MLTDETQKRNNRENHNDPFTLAYNIKPVDLQPVYPFISLLK
jgi:hypothetical protein